MSKTKERFLINKNGTLRHTLSTHYGFDISYDIDRDVNFKKDKQARTIAYKFTRDIFRLVEKLKDKCAKKKLKIHHITIE